MKITFDIAGIVAIDNCATWSAQNAHHIAEHLAPAYVLRDTDGTHCVSLNFGDFHKRSYDLVTSYK